MRIRLITVALAFFIIAFHIPSGFSLSNQVQSLGLSLSQRVAVEALNLERNLERLKTDCQKNDLIENTLSHVQRLRAEFPTQFKGEEKQMTGLMKKIELQREQLLECKI